MQRPAERNLLILSGDLGDGHKQAACALQYGLSAAPFDYNAEVVDFMEWTHPRLHAAGRYCYVSGVKHFPSLYGYLFQKTRRDNAFSQLLKKVRLYQLDRILFLLEEKRPDIIVSTFPSAAAAMSLLKSHGLTEVPTVTVITDHTDHSYWLHPYTDRYIVGSEHVRDGLLRQHVPESLIAVTGIPLRPSFCEAQDRAQLARRHGLDANRPVLLVMGGGLGLIGKDVAELVLSGRLDDRLQILFVCGHNTKLRDRLQKAFAGSPHSVRVLGYVDHVHELMALADLIVTKPGGLTTSEAVASELPMLLYKPLPGQEQDNAAYLVSAGLAKQAANIGELAEQLINLFQNPQILTTIKKRARQFQMKSATQHAATVIAGTRSTTLPVRALKQPALIRG